VPVVCVTQSEPLVDDITRPELPKAKTRPLTTLMPWIVMLLYWNGTSSSVHGGAVR